MIVLCVVIGNDDTSLILMFCKLECLLCLLWLDMFGKLFIILVQVSVRVGHVLLIVSCVH